MLIRVQPCGSVHKQAFVYLVGLKSSNRKYEMSVDKMMDREVANPLRMLSAYLMTTAMTKPPKACRQRKQCLKPPCEHSCDVEIPRTCVCVSVHQTHSITNTAVNKRSGDPNEKIRNITVKPVRQRLCR